MVLSNLPTDCVAHVFSFLPGEDISRFKRLSKYYNEIIGIYQSRLSRPLISIYINGDIFGPSIAVEIRHKRNEWKRSLMRPPVLVQNEEQISKLNKIRQFVSLKSLRKRFTKSSGGFSKEEEEEELISHDDFFSSYRDEHSSDGMHNLLSLLEFTLEKADIDYWFLYSSLYSKQYNSILTEALKNTSGRVLHVQLSSAEVDCNLLKSIGNKQFANKKYPIMHIDFSTRSKNIESEKFWNKSGLINEIASGYGYVLLRFDDMDYGILKIVEMWTENGCPTINFNFEVKAPWFFAEWDLSKYRSLWNLEISLENRKQSILFKDKGRAKILRLDKVYSTKRGIHDRKPHPYYLSVAIKVYNEY